MYSSRKKKINQPRNEKNKKCQKLKIERKKSLKLNITKSKVYPVSCL